MLLKGFGMFRYRQCDELYDDDTDNDDDSSFHPLLLTTGQLEEGEDGRRSAKVMKVVGDGGWSIPSDTGEQWMRERCVGEVRGKMNGLNCVPTNDACVPFFAQTGHPNVDSGLVWTSARMLMMSLSKRNYMGTIRVPFVLTKR